MQHCRLGGSQISLQAVSDSCNLAKEHRDGNAKEIWRGAGCLMCWFERIWEFCALRNKIASDNYLRLGKRTK